MASRALARVGHPVPCTPILTAARPPSPATLSLAAGHPRTMCRGRCESAPHCHRQGSLTSPHEYDQYNRSAARWHWYCEHATTESGSVDGGVLRLQIFDAMCGGGAQPCFGARYRSLDRSCSEPCSLMRLSSCGATRLWRSTTAVLSWCWYTVAGVARLQDVSARLLVHHVGHDIERLLFTAVFCWR